MPENAPEFDLPEEIMAVLPTDPYEQLDVARKITSIALAMRVSKLEAEAARLRQSILEKDEAIAELHERLQKLEDSLGEAEDRLSIATHEKESLLNENASLSNAVKKLNRDVAKLEVFRKTLMQSLQDEELSSTASTTAFTKSSPENVSFSSEAVTGVQNQYSETRSLVAEDPNSNDVDAFTQGISGSLLLASQSSTPRVTPPDSPTRFSSVSPTRTSKTASPPRQHSSSISSARHTFDSSISTSRHSSVSSGSDIGRGRVDGKEFFQQVRRRLSYEQFAAFLANVKELNSHKQTREETLWKADQIFGPENKDLYVIFEGLITRSMH